MKKLLCVMLVLLLVFGIASFPRASALENHCALFDSAINSLRWHAPFWDVAAGSAFPVSSIMDYTRNHLSTDEYGKDLITNGDFSYYATYAIPADVFEAMAMDSFAIVDVEILRSYTSFFWDHVNFTGIDNFQHYQPDEHVYLFSNYGGMGDPSWYEVLGYTEEDGLYTVYSRFVSLLWDTPTGVEGVDYIRIGDDYFEILHYLRTVMAISNGRAQFHSWEEIESIPDVEMTTPLTVIHQSEQVTIEASDGVFPADTVIDIQEPEAERLLTIQSALGDLVTDFVAYDITATAQPDGTAWITFAMPEGFDATRLALFYISDDGVAQQLEAVVDAEQGTITAALTHFSVYAVAQLAETAPLPGDANGDGKVNTRDARLVLQFTAGLIGEEDLQLDLADINGDGKVNTRDARAILQQTAGLN